MSFLPDFLDDSPPLSDDQLEAYFDWDNLPEEAPTVEPSDTQPDKVLLALGPDANIFTTQDDADATVARWNTADAARRWEITDRTSAEWAMRKLVRAEADLRTLAADVGEWRRQLDVYEANARRKPERVKAFMEHHLIEYLRRLRREDPKHKSEALPSGEITSRKVGATLEVTNADAFLAWAKKWLKAAVRVKEEPAKVEIKKAVVWRDVLVPDFGEFGDVVYEVQGTLVAYPALSDASSLRDSNPANLVNYHAERAPVVLLAATQTPEDEGGHNAYLLVPGLVEVPEHVNYDVKPIL